MCVYVYAYSYVYICFQIYTYLYTYEHIYVLHDIFTFFYRFLYLHVHIYIYTYICKCMSMCIDIYMYNIGTNKNRCSTRLDHAEALLALNIHIINMWNYIPASTCQCHRARTARTCWSWPHHCRTSRACPFPAWTGAGTPSERWRWTHASYHCLRPPKRSAPG